MKRSIQAIMLAVVMLLSITAAQASGTMTPVDVVTDSLGDSISIEYYCSEAGARYVAVVIRDCDHPQFAIDILTFNEADDLLSKLRGARGLMQSTTDYVAVGSVSSTALATKDHTMVLSVKNKYDEYCIGAINEPTFQRLYDAVAHAQTLVGSMGNR